jgi:hypothetical protein
MTMDFHLAVVTAAWFAGAAAWTNAAADRPRPTRKFEIRNDRDFLGGHEVDLWGLRCGNALHSWSVTERHVRAMDNMKAHGINLIGVYIQGSHGGWPDPNAGLNGFRRDGQLKPDVAKRLEWLVREADERGMVVMVGLFSPRKDQEFLDEQAIRRAVEETGQFLVERRLKNVFVDIIHEFDHSERIDQEIFREPNGAAKKAKLTGWFKAVAPDIEVGICPNHQTGSPVDYPGCEVKLFHEAMPIPEAGFAVNTETADRDLSGNEGVFNRYHIESMHKEWETYRHLPHAAMLFRSPYVEDVRGRQGTGPNFEMGGHGTGESDRGVQPYFQWLLENVGPWKYPQHVARQSK